MSMPTTPRAPRVVAEQLGIQVLTGPGGGRPLPYPVRELADGEALLAGDVPLAAFHAPGPRPDHLVFVASDQGVARFALVGDLDGGRGARSITGPPDLVAWASSLDRVERLAPGARRLAGHPSAPAAI